MRNRSDSRRNHILKKVALLSVLLVYMGLVFVLTSASTSFTGRFVVGLYKLFGSHKMQSRAIRRYFRTAVTMNGFGNNLFYVIKKSLDLRQEVGRPLLYHFGWFLMRWGLLDDAKKVLTLVEPRGNDRLTLRIWEKLGDIARLARVAEDATAAGRLQPFQTPARQYICLRYNPIIHSMGV